MAINVSQAFKRTSKNPIDETFALTKAQMLTVNDNLMPDYYFTVCQDDGCFYLYDKTATASLTTGKFTKFEGGTDNLVFGYLNSTNGKFYKESTYTTEIAGDTSKLYITLDTNYLYRYDNGFVQIGGSSVGGTVEGYLNPTNGKFYADSAYTTEITGEAGKLYVTLDTDKTYRYDSTNGFVLVGGGDGETIQYDTMPTASSTLVGTIVQYVGSTTATYTKGYWYECVLDGATYKWQNIQVQEGGTGGSNNFVKGYYYNGGFYEEQAHTTPITGERDKIYLDIPNEKCYEYDGANFNRVDDEEIKRSALPTADASNLGAIYLYTGSTTGSYTHGYFYECVSDGAVSPTYSWSVINGGASSLSQLTDVNLTNLQDGQILKYNGTSGKFENTEDAGGQTIQYETLPTASADNLGDIVWYTGATAGGLVNGYTYKCVSDGENPATYSWVAIPTQDCPNPQVSSLPTASASLVGTIYQFIGTTTVDYTNGYFYECVESSETAGTYLWTQKHVDDGVPSGGTTGQVLQKASDADGDVEWGDIDIGNIPVMRGATNYDDGERGLAPKPTTADVGKALFGDGHYHTIYSAASGSTILAVTTDSALYGRTVTLTDGTHTMTETMGNDGECYFTDVTMFGSVTLSCTDSEGNEAKASLNLTYFGTYQCNLTLNFATLHFTSSDLDIIGKTVTVYKNNVQVATTTLRLVGGQMVADVFVEELGDYVAKVEQSTSGIGTANVTVSALRQTYNVPLLIYHIYAYQIDENDSNPATCVTAYESAWGCENLNFTPAHMDFANDTFVMGSWTGNEFFFPKPCMLKYDGTVDYYLDPTDYTKKADGTASDVANFAYNGNVMVEFPTVYFNRWQAGNKTYVVMSNKQLTSDFHAYAHHDKNGNVLPYIYLAAYDGSYDGTRLRSISGIAANNNGSSLATNKIMNFTTCQQEINFAVANNSGIAEGHEGYFTTHKADGDLVIDLLTLIGYSTNSQATFGRGRDTGYVSVTNTGIVTTGSMNTKGMFWGENQGAAGVKVFGIENFWGNLWKQRAGWINANGTQKVKMTWGQEDGSTVDGFNTTGSGYVTVSGATPAGTSGGYINKWKKTAQGFIPYNAAGSDSTYVCDGLLFNNSQVDYVLCAGNSNSGLPVGAFCSSLGIAVSVASWGLGAALSCK